MKVDDVTADGQSPKRARLLATIPLLFLCAASAVQAEYSPIVISPPAQDAVDENYVSVLTGKLHFSLPALKLGDVSFEPYTVNQQFAKALSGGGGGVADGNYGHIVLCFNPSSQSSYAVTTDCVSQVASLQAVYGEQRSSFQYQSGTYTAVMGDGSAFVDQIDTTGATANTCTWTQRDGTQIVYAGFHTSGNPLCQSHNILRISHPDGRIQTYYYSGGPGAFSTNTNYTPSPIVSIATNSGFLLKYIYPGTPAYGGESSVIAINRAYETCDPVAVSCTLTNSWPTATLSWVDTPVNPVDGYLPSSVAGYNLHYMFTVMDEAHKKHVFELDSLYRVISYQPPEATTPVYYYTLCSLHADGQGTPASPRTLTNCFGYTQYDNDPSKPDTPFIPLYFDLVASSMRNSQTWTYGSLFSQGSYPLSHSQWQHVVTHPLGLVMSASGNSTPGTESQYGPIDTITHYDGTVNRFERTLQNTIATQTTPAGIVKSYGWDVRGNVTSITTNPVSGSSLPAVQQSAVYPTSCTNMITCNKPTSVTDGNGNTTSFTYDPIHGGVLTQTEPAVSAVQPQPSVTPPSTVQPQTRSTYVQSFAWYKSSSGVMTRETNGIYLLKTESFCISGPAVVPAGAPGSGCTNPNDEVVTTYDYGPDSGPNNLLLRGKTVSAQGKTQRTCYGHDRQGNRIWESSPNANPAGCPAY